MNLTENQNVSEEEILKTLNLVTNYNNLINIIFRLMVN